MGDQLKTSDKHWQCNFLYLKVQSKKLSNQYERHNYWVMHFILIIPDFDGPLCIKVPSHHVMCTRKPTETLHCVATDTEGS